MTLTDLSGRETYTRVTGGMKVKVDREKSSLYARMMAASDVYSRLKLLKGQPIYHYNVFFFIKTNDHTLYYSVNRYT